MDRIDSQPTSASTNSKARRQADAAAEFLQMMSPGGCYCCSNMRDRSFRTKRLSQVGLVVQCRKAEIGLGVCGNRKQQPGKAVALQR